ncbi:response regulator [Saccharothrix deserti]|uniref:response regulator n=1 Tax=Saccharothrix deserti TaxID=2593674 RepID=UPI00131DD741|nr:response regulator transcription factor [Saccharothrix deserti]
MTPLRIRVLLVDDHRMFRAGVRALLEGEPDLEVVGETGDGEGAIRLTAELRPGVVLMDLRLAGEGGGMDGVEATRRILTTTPGAAVVVLTSYGTEADVVRAMTAGARGYVLKAGAPDELFQAVRTAAGGGVGLAPDAAARVVSRLTNPEPVLTEREVEVIRLVARGLSNRAIATSLFLTEATIKTHLVRLYRKLGADNRVGAVSEAVRRGLVELH